MNYVTQFELFVVVTNRECYLAECVNSFRSFYPHIPISVIDNSGDGRYVRIINELGATAIVNDTVRSVSQNQNMILELARTPFFVFSADDIVFIRGGFVEDAAILLAKGFDIVSLAADDPCAFAMKASKELTIGKFNECLGGKETTDLDIKARACRVYGHLPSVGRYFHRVSGGFWESYYIRHHEHKPDVNDYLKSRGLARNAYMNESRSTALLRLFALKAASFKAEIAGVVLRVADHCCRRGMPRNIWSCRHEIPSLRDCRELVSIGQVPRHYFWPANLVEYHGGSVESVSIVEKCAPYIPYLQKKFGRKYSRFQAIADDVLNVEKHFAPKSVDLCVWYDGPEHLPHDEAECAIKSLERICRGVIILGAPDGFLPQDTDQSFKNIQNASNRHLSGWTRREFEDLGYGTGIVEHGIPTIIAWKRVV